MENTRNSLKLSSICILVLVFFSLAISIFNLLSGKIVFGELPEGVTQELANIAVIVVWAIGAIMLLPRVYIGVKGLKMAKNPDDSKAHIVWAFIYIILSVISLFSSVGNLLNSADLLSDILALCETVLSGSLYVFYFIEAKKLRSSL